MNTKTPSPPSGSSSFAELVRQRRATAHFLPDEVPEADITQAFLTAAEAPSGFNTQPWRFLTLRNEANRVALRKAAYDQEKITEAPLVIVAYGLKEGWEEPLVRIQQEKARRLGMDGSAAERLAKSASDFVHKMNMAVWLNRHVMIAFTYLMLAFEDLGWDTAPMEGFDPQKVKEAFSLPADVEVIALLAVGRTKDNTQKHPGRQALDQFVSDEAAGKPWHGKKAAAGA
ncbi:MAG: nitroreductase family protein [Nibricoccus sp.]